MVDAPEKIWARPDPATVYMDGSSPLVARDVDILSALNAAGYRILAPGELDRETVERCAEVAESLPWFIEASPAHIRGRSPAEYAAAIRTLTDGGHDA